MGCPAHRCNKPWIFPVPRREEMNDTSFPPKPSPPPIKHSRLGIASSIIAVLAVVTIGGYIGAVLLLRKQPAIVQDFAALDSVLTCLAAILTFVGLGMGIATVVQKETRRIFGLLGLVFNGLFLLVICVLYVINVFALMRAGGV
jgi:hypothetical protein